MERFIFKLMSRSRDTDTDKDMDMDMHIERFIYRDTGQDSDHCYR
jgi:hypothetical protein